jgi:hypothetical protein
MDRAGLEKDEPPRAAPWNEGGIEAARALFRAKSAAAPASRAIPRLNALPDTQELETEMNFTASSIV